MWVQFSMLWTRGMAHVATEHAFRSTWTSVSRHVILAPAWQRRRQLLVGSECESLACLSRPVAIDFQMGGPALA